MRSLPYLAEAKGIVCVGEVGEQRQHLVGYIEWAAPHLVLVETFYSQLLRR